MKNQRFDPTIIPILGTSFNGVRHGAVSIHGGLSKQPYFSNNISFGVGDDRQNVVNNRITIKRQFGLKSLVSAHQVHGENIYYVERDVPEDFIADGYDALITNQKGVGLMIGHADCQAVLLYDSVNKVIAAVHNGWRGSVVDIVGKTIAVMEKQFGTDCKQVKAGIGPSLGPCCAEFVNYKKELPQEFWSFQRKKYHFDFWEITRQQLLQRGVSENAIHITGVCTSCSSDFFSYRRACRENDGVTGRNGSVIALI